MKIVIPGGSGQVGAILAREFHTQAHEVIVLSRVPQPAEWKVVAWDARTIGDWCREFEAADVVINLAGRSVDCRYTKKNRREIMDSRVDSTRAVGHAIRNARNPPKVWLQASTATIYSHRYDAANDEITGIVGGDETNVPDTWRFSIDVARAWEAAAMEQDLPHTRRVLLRSAMVMSPDRGGVLDVLLKLVRFRLGGKSGDGRQYMSWIHDRDFIRSIEWLIEHPFEGAVNIASPSPLPNESFMRILRSAAGIKFGFSANRWMLELGTFLLRTESELILKSRRVVPTRLIESGFRFDFADWEHAARDLCGRWRNFS